MRARPVHKNHGIDKLHKLRIRHVCSKRGHVQLHDVLWCGLPGRTIQSGLWRQFSRQLLSLSELRHQRMVIGLHGGFSRIVFVMPTVQRRLFLWGV